MEHCPKYNYFLKIKNPQVKEGDIGNFGSAVLAIF